MLEQIFLKVANMSLTASIIIVAVLLVRILLKRFPKYLSYMLWGVVLFRLLCPLTIESNVSPVPKLETVFYEYISEKSAVSIGMTASESAAWHTGEEVKSASDTGQMTPVQFQQTENTKNMKVSRQETIILYGKYVWIAGFGIMLLYCMIATVKIRNKVLLFIPLKENIYIVDETISPFVMGLIHPKIYLPECLCEKELEYIILHERFHIRRFDHVLKPLAFAALCIHWFNPLVWIAFTLFCKDMEMSWEKLSGRIIPRPYWLSPHSTALFWGFL